MIDLLFIVKQKAECLGILTKDINISLCLFVRTIHYRLFVTMQNDNIVSLCTSACVFALCMITHGTRMVLWQHGGVGDVFNESSQMWALFSSLQGKCVRLLRSSIICVCVCGWVYVSMRTGGLHCQANILESCSLQRQICLWNYHGNDFARFCGNAALFLLNF